MSSGPTNPPPRALLYCWAAFGAAALALGAIGWVALDGLTFDPAHTRAFAGAARGPSIGPILALGAALNALLIAFYRLSPDSPHFARLNIPRKAIWLSTPELRRELSSRMRRVFAALGAYVDFLIATTFYMTLQYFYPWIPCPRHLLMLLVWMVLTGAVAIYALRQFRLPARAVSPG